MVSKGAISYFSCLQRFGRADFVISVPPPLFLSKKNRQRFDDVIGIIGKLFAVKIHVSTIHRPFSGSAVGAHYTQYAYLHNIHTSSLGTLVRLSKQQAFASIPGGPISNRMPMIVLLLLKTRVRQTCQIILL